MVSVIAFSISFSSLALHSLSFKCLRLHDHELTLSDNSFTPGKNNSFESQQSLKVSFSLCQLGSGAQADAATRCVYVKLGLKFGINNGAFTWECWPSRVMH